jgi:hypothetical protein
MVLRGLGYTDESLTGSWPTNYKIKALNIDLLDDVDVAAAGADRGNIAIMLYNALFLAYGEVDEDGLWQANEDGKDDDGDTIAKLVIDKIGDLVEMVQISFEDVYDDDDALDTVIDLEPYLFHIVDYYENADGDVAYIDNVYTDEIDLDDVTSDGSYSWYEGEDADDDIQEFDIDDVSGAAMFNYAEVSGSDMYNNYEGALEGADVTVIYADDEDVDGNDDGDYDSEEAVGVIALRVTETVQVQEDYDNGDDEVEASSDIQLPVDDDEDFDESRLSVMGDVDSVEDIEEDDVVEIYEPYDFDYDDEDGDMLTLVVTRDMVSGEVDEFDGDDSIVIDGVELDYGNDFDMSDLIAAADLGDEYTAYLNADGEIAFLELTEEAATAEDFAVVVGLADGSVSEDWDDIEIDDAPQIKLLTADNDIVIYDVTTDDFDFVGGESEIWAIGNIDLAWDGDVDDVVDISGVSVGTIVLYSMDDDGEIDDIDVYDSDFYYDSTAGSDYDEPVLDGGYIVEDTTIVFDLTEDDEDDWEVIDMDQLDADDAADIYYVTEDGDNEVIVMSVDMNDTTSDGEYALITKVTVALDGDDPVQKLTGFIAGEADVVYTDDDDDFDDMYVDEFLIELTMDGDVVESTTVEGVDVEGIVQDLNGDFVKVDGSYYEIDSEVVVYEITFEDDGDVDEVMVIDFNDVDEDGYVKFFDTDNDVVDGDDDEIDVIFYVTEKDVDESGYAK